MVHLCKEIVNAVSDFETVRMDNCTPVILSDDCTVRART